MNKILVPVDFSPHSLNALERAVKMKDSLEAEVELVFVREGGFLQWIMGSKKEAVEKLDQEVQQQLDELKNQYGINFAFHQREGKIYENIVKVADEIEAFMIMMGSHGHSGFEEFWVGGNAYKTVSAANVPVMTIPEHFSSNQFKEIVLPIDRSENTRHKVPFTKDIAEYFNARIHVTGVCRDNEDETVFKIRQYTNQVAEFMEEHDVPLKQDILFGKNITEVTLEYADAEKADLISIMTEQEVSPDNLFLGPYAQQMINHSHIPVLSNRPNPKYTGVITY